MKPTFVWFPDFGLVPVLTFLSVLKEMPLYMPAHQSVGCGQHGVTSVFSISSSPLSTTREAPLGGEGPVLPLPLRRLQWSPWTPVLPAGNPACQTRPSDNAGLPAGWRGVASFLALPHILMSGHQGSSVMQRESQSLSRCFISFWDHLLPGR